MKRIILIASITGAVGLAQVSQAITVQPRVQVASTIKFKIPTYTIATPNSNPFKEPTSAPSTPTPAPKAFGLSTMKSQSKFLGSIVYNHEGNLNVGTISYRRVGYTPAPVIKDPNPVNSTGSSGSPTNPHPGGVATIPDTSATAGLLGMALFGTALMRRKIAFC